MALPVLFRTLSLSHWRAERLKFLLTLAGMTLGVAVYCAIRLSNQTVFDSFSESASTISGTGSLTVVSARGRIEEAFIPKIRALPGIAAVSPVSTAYVNARADGRDCGIIRLVGTDLFESVRFGYWKNREAAMDRQTILRMLTEEGRVFVSRKLHEDLAGSPLGVLVNGRTVPLHEEAVIPGGLMDAFGGKTAVMDIAWFQKLMDEYGSAEFLNLLPAAGVSRENLSRGLKNISEDLSLEDAADRTRVAGRMTEAFRLNLSFLAVISLFVGFLLIYNTVSYSILKRRNELGILQAIGARPGALFRLICLEGAVLGAAASVLGILAGCGLSLFETKLIARSISDLYFPVEVTGIRVSPGIVTECMILGPAVALLGSLLPGLEIFTVPPRETFAYQTFESRFRRIVPALSLAGIFFLLISLAAARRSFLHIHLWMGFVSPVFLVSGIILLVPAGLLALTAAGTVFRKTGLFEGWLALDHIGTMLERNSVAVASAMTAVGMFIGVSIMILSFRGTVERWIHHITKADLYISAGGPAQGQEGAKIPQDFIEAALQEPGVRDYDWIATRRLRMDGRIIRVHGVRFSIIRKYDRLLFRDLEAAGIPDEGAAYVSETFAERFGVKTGGLLKLPGADQRPLRIRNVFFDYSSDQGIILIPDSVFREFFHEDSKNGLALYLLPGSSDEALRERLLARFPGYHLTIRANRTLRGEVLKVFDRTFEITKVLQAIALAIAGLAILNTVLMLMLEREKELAVFAAIGASQASMIRMILAEALLLGAAACAAGFLLGILLAAFLVFVVNKFFFAWSVSLVLPWPVFFRSAAGILAASLAAGFVPAWRFARISHTKALRYE